QTLTALERGLPLYELYFVRKWRRSLRRKQAAWPGSYDFRAMERLRGLRRMTAEMVRCYSEFPTLEDYLNGYAITGGRLARLEVPSSLLTSLDDPIIPADGLERLARSPALSITVTRHGGSRQALEPVGGNDRSEEHTSELQSLAYLVCRLLLEKK